MPNSLAVDVVASLDLAARSSLALDGSLADLRIAICERRFRDVEAIRARMLAAVDGYVDHIVAAAMRVEYERGA